MDAERRRQQRRAWYLKNKFLPQVIKKRHADQKKYRKKNRDRDKARHRKWYLKNKAYVRSLRISPSGKFKHYISNAIRRSLTFTLTFEEFKALIFRPCEYCGKIESGGVDRINNELGYIAGNTASCCAICNSMKHKRKKDDFIEACRAVVNYQNMLNLRQFSIWTLERPESDDSSSMRRSYRDTGEVVAGSVDLAPAEFAAISGGEFGKTFRFHSDRVDSILKIGDRLIGGGDTYEVKGVTRQRDAPLRNLQAVLFEAVIQ